jgi:hypothetical protein
MRFVAYARGLTLGRCKLFVNGTAHDSNGFAGCLRFFAAAWQVGNSSSSSGVAGKQHFAMAGPREKLF